MASYDQYIGELTPGATGWLPLDDQGMPNGPATLAPPAFGVMAMRVVATNAPVPPGFPLMSTVSGAPIGDRNEAGTESRRTHFVYTP
jgi:hypothetical protein